MQRLLVAIDFSDFTPALLAQAATLARALHAEVFLVHVEEGDPEFVGYDAGPQSRRDGVARQIRGDHRQLQAFADQLFAAGIPTTALLVQGATAEKLLSEATRLRADVIIMGTHGHGALRRLLVGSVGEAVLRQAPCPVLFVPLARRDQPPA